MRVRSLARTRAEPASGSGGPRSGKSKRTRSMRVGPSNSSSAKRPITRGVACGAGSSSGWTPSSQTSPRSQRRSKTHCERSTSGGRVGRGRRDGDVGQRPGGAGVERAAHVDGAASARRPTRRARAAAAQRERERERGLSGERRTTRQPPTPRRPRQAQTTAPRAPRGTGDAATQRRAVRRRGRRRAPRGARCAQARGRGRSASVTRAGPP